MFNSNVIVEWTGSRTMTLVNDVSFIDSEFVEWRAEAGTVIDGASIPRVLWTAVGSPFVGKYRRASVIHDAYYKTQDVPRADVDRMFYEAMLADGVGSIRARVMYRAVRMFGARW